MARKEEYLSYHCPRYSEWTGIELYMDQVISLLEENVALFYPKNADKAVTSTMINNYVKQDIIRPSKKKKYQRYHLAFLYLIFLLKPVVNLYDITGLLAYMEKQAEPSQMYDALCDNIESSLKAAFGEESGSADAHDDQILAGISLAFARTLLARDLLEEQMPAQNIKGKKSKNEKARREV